jgi:flagellar biosynthesis protein FliP
MMGDDADEKGTSLSMIGLRQINIFTALTFFELIVLLMAEFTFRAITLSYIRLAEPLIFIPPF